MAKKVLLFFVAWLFSIALFLTVATASLGLALRAGHIKSWLKQSGVYPAAVDEIILQAGKIQFSDQSQISLKDPGVQLAARQAFTPQFAQNVSEQFIDGTFHWLNGKVTQPDFAINVAPAKNAFADNIGTYLKTRAAALPVCTRDQVTSTVNVFTMTCKPPVNFDVNSVIDDQIQQIKTSPDYLSGSQVIKANDVKLTNGAGQQEPAFQQLRHLPTIYQWLERAPYLLGLLAILLSAVIIFSSPSKWRGSKRVMRALISAAVLITVYTILTALGLSKFSDRIANTIQGSTVGFRLSILNIVKLANHEVMKISIIFAVVFMLLAFGILLVHIWDEKKHPERYAKPKPANTPEKTPEASKAPPN